MQVQSIRRIWMWNFLCIFFRKCHPCASCAVQCISDGVYIYIYERARESPGCVCARVCVYVRVSEFGGRALDLVTGDVIRGALPRRLSAADRRSSHWKTPPLRFTYVYRRTHTAAAAAADTCTIRKRVSGKGRGRVCFVGVVRSTARLYTNLWHSVTTRHACTPGNRGSGIYR